MLAPAAGERLEPLAELREKVAGNRDENAGLHAW
jgi:hypothetical protein